MKTSQTFFYNEENGNIQYLDKREFIGELCIVISKKDKNILCLDEIKKIYNLSYKDIVKKFEKVFKKLDNNIYGLKVQPKLGLICLIDKSTEDFEKYCRKNKLKFGQEVSNINKKNLFTKEGKCDIINYKPKESKEELKSMNKKLVKRVAVASLAALMTIPSLTINSYADALSMAQNRLKNYEQQLKNYEAYGNIEMVEKTKERITQTKNDIEKAKQNNEVKAQKTAQAQALQAEKDRIANTVYPLTAKYVKDFVPAVNDYQPHFYERPELPGVIFTLQQDSFGRLTDVKPNFKIEKIEDFHRESRPYDKPELKFDDICETIKVTYTSPFNCVLGGGSYILGDFGLYSDRNQFTGEWCHWIGENRTVIMDRVLDMHYKSGWPDYYIGKSVKEINETNYDPAYGFYMNSETAKTAFGQYTLQEIINKARVVFNNKERADKNKHTTVNNAVGANWIYEQDIYSVAREHGTD